MSEEILFVDDEPNVLDAYRRELEPDYSVTCAAGGAEGLAAIDEKGPFAVIVTDMQMDGMNGIEFLTRVREKCPDSVRLMLTGGNMASAVEAVNEGRIFRFLTKPCPGETLRKALDAALAQYQLVTAERNIMSTTVLGAVRILVDMLAAVRPVTFGRTMRVRNMVRRMAEELNPHRVWQADVAALLSQSGCIYIAERTLERAYSGRELDADELESFQSYPRRGSALVANVPRLKDVAEIVANQERGFDGSGFPDDGKSGEALPLESRMLKAALDYDSLISSGNNPMQALTTLYSRKGRYDPKVVDTLKKIVVVAVAQNLMAVAET